MKLFCQASIVGFIILWSLSNAGFCEAPQFDEQFVYQLKAYNGKGYPESFVPRSEDTIYFLANINNVILPRYTLVYFWPLTGKYVAAYKKLNEDVEGALEIVQNGKVIRTLEKEEYAIFYPKGMIAEIAQLHVGNEAYEIFQNYESPLTEFYARTASYNEAMLDYRAKLVEFAEEIERKKNAGEVIAPEDVQANMPKEPVRPDPPSFDLTGLQNGFIINLPQGEYQIRLKGRDNTIIEDTSKKLIVFSKRRTDQVGYEIIPGNRWTKKEKTNDASSSIYASGNNILYFQAFKEDEYNELYFNKLIDPQSYGHPAKWIWVHAQPTEALRFILEGQQDKPAEIPHQPFLVQQIPGPELGYEILPYQEELFPDRRPTFEGYQVNISESGQDRKYRFWLEDGNRRMVQSSDRRIVLIDKKNIAVLYAVSAFPLLVGLIILVLRNRTRRIE